MPSPGGTFHSLYPPPECLGCLCLVPLPCRRDARQRSRRHVRVVSGLNLDKLGPAQPNLPSSTVSRPTERTCGQSRLRRFAHSATPHLDPVTPTTTIAPTKTGKPPLHQPSRLFARLTRRASRGLDRCVRFGWSPCTGAARPLLTTPMMTAKGYRLVSSVGCCLVGDFLIRRKPATHEVRNLFSFFVFCYSLVLISMTHRHFWRRPTVTSRSATQSLQPLRLLKCRTYRLVRPRPRRATVRN